MFPPPQASAVGLNRRKPPGVHRRPPGEASSLETSHAGVLLPNALADNRLATEDLEPYPLPGRVYRNARGAAEHPQQEVAPTAAGNAECAIANRLDRDVPLRARNAAHRDALRGLNRLGEREARADRLVQTLENEHRAAAVAEEPKLLGLCATLDRKIAHIPLVLLPGNGNRGDGRNGTEHRHRRNGHSHRPSPFRGAGVSLSHRRRRWATRISLRAPAGACRRQRVDKSQIMAAHGSA